MVLKIQLVARTSQVYGKEVKRFSALAEVKL